MGKSKAAERVERFLTNWQPARSGSTTWIARARPTANANDYRWAALTARDLRLLIAEARADERHRQGWNEAIDYAIDTMKKFGGCNGGVEKMLLQLKSKAVTRG